MADPSAPHPAIHVVSYGPDELQQRDIHDLGQLSDLVGQRPVTWVDIAGLGDAATIKRIGQMFGLHPLALEDVVNVHQRSKVEDYGEHLFVVARMALPGEESETEQVSLFLGKDFVVTFQERPGDCLAPVRQRLRKTQGKIRQAGTDYLAYALLDAVVDGYFPVLEEYGERLEHIDEELSAGAARATTARLHDLRTDLLLLRRAIWPLRDAMSELAREPNPLIQDETRLFLRDCYDHTVQIIDLVETSRETCADLRELHLSLVSNRMNEVMKVLTIIATIFIPLSFITGIYGMNFDPTVSGWNMPELRWQHGYPFALGLMAAIAAGLLYLFWRRGWLEK